MGIYLVLCVAAALIGVGRAECDACLDGLCYRKHLLPVSSAHKLEDINRHTNTLYLSNNRILGQYQLDTGVFKNLTITQELLRLVVDQGTGDIYGSILHERDYSLFKLDLVKNEKELLVRGGVDDLVFKDKLYYSALSTGIYTYEGGKSRKIAGTENYYVFGFVVDKNDDIYFNTVVNYVQFTKWLSKTSIFDVSVDLVGHSYFRTDKDGNIVCFHPRTRAVYRLADGEATAIGATKDSISLSEPLYDRDNNIICGTADGYYHLKRDEKGVHCTFSILENNTIITETVVNMDKVNVVSSTTPVH